MVYLDERNNLKIEDIELVAKEIKNGKIAIFPTETVYGIGTNAFDNKACKKIYDIKDRPENKALIVLISDINMLNELVQNTNEIEKKLIKEFWPGALTIVFDKKEECKLSEVVTAGKTTIAVRMTDGEISKMIVQKAGVPIVAPSANLSGKPSGTKIENIINDLGSNVDYVLDCGDINDDTTSTLVRVEKNKIKILREGRIVKEQLQKIAEIEEI